MSSAYLSWEATHRLQHGDPLDLRTIPSVVGSDPTTRHGIVLAEGLKALTGGVIQDEDYPMMFNIL